MPSIDTLGISDSRNTDLMQVLGYTSAETLLYDYSSSEVFYLLVKPFTLYQVSPPSAWQWFGVNNGAVIVYNPFLGRTGLPFTFPPPFPSPPTGEVYLLGSDGDYLLGSDGDYLLGVIN